MPNYDKLAYEKRYYQVYKEGALFWEDPTLTQALVDLIKEIRFPTGAKVIDLGCNSIFLATKLKENLTRLRLKHTYRLSIL